MRYNVFLMVHKGLRALLYDTSLSLQQTDFATATGTPESLDKLALTLDVFDSHAGHEDNHIFCMLNSCNPELMSEMEAEHVTDHALSNKLRELITSFKTATNPNDKLELGTKICLAYNEFIAFNLTHLNKEETMVNESLWKNYTDLDIIRANQQLVSSLSPEEARRSAIWMIRSCSNRELITWINGIKNNIPALVMQMLMQLVEQELPEGRMEVVLNGIMEIA